MCSREPENRNFLEECLLAQKELGRRQREYKKILSTRLKTRSDHIVEQSLGKTIDSLRAERNVIKAQIFVADGKSHKLDLTRALDFVKCHVDCQEHLSSDIHKLKVVITNMEREMSRVDKIVYDLNRKTVPDSQFQAHVSRVRKKMTMLENRLEVGIRRESGFTATNAALREEVKNLLCFRAFFYTAYTKLVLKLNSDKKYLLDLLEYAFNTYDGCISIHEKTDGATARAAKEIEHAKIEMQSLMRKLAASEEQTAFLRDKSSQRVLAAMLPKEHRRRDNFRHNHVRKIELYNAVLNKLLHYTDSHNVDAVIEKFQHQESLYYSYFSFANEMSFHVTLLNNAVNRLFYEVKHMKSGNQKKLAEQEHAIAILEAKLKQKRARNEELRALKETNDKRLEKLLEGINYIFMRSHAKAAPLMLLLGDHKFVNLSNMSRFLKILEQQVYSLVASVFVLERADENLTPHRYTVKNAEKISEPPTLLEDIVLTQQCPECAEGEAFNLDDDAHGSIMVSTLDECKLALNEKVNQPEMQYRLHSISQCRLPRSRILAAKRNS